MGLNTFGFEDLPLIEGESIDMALRLASDEENGNSEKPMVMLLTDKRVIHLNGNGKNKRAVFASIKDIDAVEVTVEREGSSAYIWAAMAFVVSILLFFVIDNTVGRIAASLIVALMGVYLIWDQLTSSGKPLVIFKAGSSELKCGIQKDQAGAEVYRFINRLFQLKEEVSGNGFGRSRYFSPR